MNPIETLLSVLFLMIYVFANFRLARQIFPQRAHDTDLVCTVYAAHWKPITAN